MAKVASEIFFRDFDFAFNAHPITGKLLIKKNNDAIIQAIKLLVMTNLYERVYRPRLGGNISNQLFDNYMPYTQEQIRSSIETAINNFDSGRAELLDIRFAGNPDDKTMQVTIVMRPRNAVQPIEVNISLGRVR